MLYFSIITILLLSALGSFLYRVRGTSDFFSLPRPLEQMLYCSAFLVAALCAGMAWHWALLAYIVSVGMTCAGHGAYFDLGRNHKFNDERPIGWFLPALGRKFGFYDERETYDLVGLMFNGLFMTLPFAVLFAVNGKIEYAILAAIAGLLKALAYFLGWNFLSDRVFGFGATEIGEYLTGFFQWFCFAWIITRYLF